MSENRISWAWLSPAGGRALATRDLGVILRAYRAASQLTQERLAEQLGYDRTYICLLERGQRAITDRGTLAYLARQLSIPPHILGVTDRDDADFLAMLQFADSTIRLAEIARQCGRAVEAVNELWPLIARLEARIAGGRVERETAIIVARARTAFGTSLGHILPDERLVTAALWTGRAVRMARRIGDKHIFAHALRMHGNELRKSGHPAAAVAHLEHAIQISNDTTGRGAAHALLARAAAEAGDAQRFDGAIDQCQRLLNATAERNILFNTFTIREIRLRGLLATNRIPKAIAVAGDAPNMASPPAPQWRIIDKITTAHVLATAGDATTASALLTDAISEAEARHLPHQIQRVIRLTSHSPTLAHDAVRDEARAALACLRESKSGISHVDHPLLALQARSAVHDSAATARAGCERG